MPGAKVRSFLKKYGMDCGSIDMDQNCRLFMEEMEQGLKGEGSSFQMIPTYLTLGQDIPVEEPVIAIDAGGTNFRVALVHFDKNKKPVIQDFKLYPMPGLNEELTDHQFFETIVQYLEPVLKKSDKIGFCFSYSAQILPDRDGRINEFSKEIKVKGAKGQLLGKSLIKAIEARGYDPDKKVVVLNDTVATLLAGKAAFMDRDFGSYIGFILGTGTNTCYMEEIPNIKKMSGRTKPGTMLINMETGGYTKAPRGLIDLEFDGRTLNPGTTVFEKTMSGAYIGGLILAVIKKAAEDMLFTKEFEERIAGVGTLAPKEVDDFLNYPYSGNNVLARCCSSSGPSDDQETLYHLIDGVIERAAKLAAINLSAVILKTGKGKNPCAPVCIAAEGSMFYKSKLFRPKLDYYIRTYLNEQKKAYCEFVKADNGSLIGSAIAGLSD